ncbi:MAG: type II toxin-antitoxin system HicA family toxin [Dehalococcoidia bacterium]
MPAKAREFEKVARSLGFVRTRQRGSHGIWMHPDGRGTVIPIHGNQDIGGGLYHAILSQLGVTEEQFRALK